MAGSMNKFHANKFEELILRRGRRVRWHEAITCSCINFSGGSHQPLYDCKACKGRGYTLMPSVENTVVIASVTHNKEFEEMSGLFEVGDAIMSVGRYIPHVTRQGNIDRTTKGTPNPIFHCGMFDYITLTDDTYKTSEVLIKGEAMYERPAETLLFSDVHEVLAVRQSNSYTGEVTTYEQGTDYIVKDGCIHWLADDPTYTPPEGVQLPTAPTQGEQYAVQYTHYPTFRILKQLPTPRYQDGQDLPKKVQLRYSFEGFRADT